MQSTQRPGANVSVHHAVRAKCPVAHEKDRESGQNAPIQAQLLPGQLLSLTRTT